MPPAFASLQRASFGGIEFPVTTVSIVGGLRDHMHEFPHSPSGQPEKLGRKPYLFRVHAPFDTNFRAYPDLWPGGLARLFHLFETGLTKQLTLPTHGSCQAYCDSWTKASEAKVLSGEAVDLSFKEDSSEAITSAGIKATYDNLRAKAQFITYYNETKKISLGEYIDRLLTDLQRALNVVIGYRDKAELYRALLSQNIQKVTRLCDEVDKTLAMMNDPIGQDLKNAVHEAWFAVIGIGAELGIGGPQFDTSPGAAAVARVFAFDTAAPLQPKPTYVFDPTTASWVTEEQYVFAKNVFQGAPIPTAVFDVNDPDAPAPEYAFEHGGAEPPKADYTFDVNDPGAPSPTYVFDTSAPPGNQTALPDFDTTAPAVAPTVRYYVTPRDMSVSEIAIELFGDASRAGDLYAMNTFVDPFHVPKGTLVMAPAS